MDLLRENERVERERDGALAGFQALSDQLRKLQAAHTETVEQMRVMQSKLEYSEEIRIQRDEYQKQYLEMKLQRDDLRDYIDRLAQAARAAGAGDAAAFGKVSEFIVEKVMREGGAR